MGLFESSDKEGMVKLKRKVVKLEISSNYGCQNLVRGLNSFICLKIKFKWVGMSLLLFCYRVNRWTVPPAVTDLNYNKTPETV